MRIAALISCVLVAVLSCAAGDGMAKREAKVRKQLAKDRPYKAISLCNGALSIEQRPVFLVLRADARNRIGEFAAAERDARAGLAALAQDREARLQLAIAEQGQGLADSSIFHYRELLAEKDEAAIRYRLATTLQGHKDYAAAITELRTVMTALDPQDPLRHRVFRSEGECLALSGDTTEAKVAFDSALALAVDDPITLNSRAWFLNAAYGRHAAAIVDYNRAIKQNPNYSYAFNNRGWSKFKSGDVEGARKDIGLARKKKPFNPYIYRNLGFIELSEGDTGEACAQFRRALDLDFTALHGDEVELLVREHCAGRTPVEQPATPAPVPEKKPAAPPGRTNAPE